MVDLRILPRWKMSLARGTDCSRKSPESAAASGWVSTTKREIELAPMWMDAWSEGGVGIGRVKSEVGSGKWEVGEREGDGGRLG